VEILHFRVITCISQGKRIHQNEVKPELLTLRAGHASTKTTTSSGTGDIGSIVTTVGQGHLCPRTLDAAHDYVVSADVSVPVPGFLGGRAEEGISHTPQRSEDCWRNTQPPAPCILPPWKINARTQRCRGDRCCRRMLEQSNSGTSRSLFD